MSAKYALRRPNSDEVELAYKGFSWSSLIFGFWVPLFRGDTVWAIICLMVTIVNMMIMTYTPWGIVTTILWAVVFAGTYNETHYESLIRRGFTVI